MLFKRYTTDEFVARAKEVHGDKYDYSSVIYTHNQNKIDITCPKHGVFTQQARLHLKGQGCKKCYDDRREGWRSKVRIEAKEKGEILYEGSPCKSGHTTRYVSSNTCAVCHQINSAIWRSNNKDRHKQMSEAWRRSNPEKAARSSLVRGRVRNQRTRQASILYHDQEVRDKINAIYDEARRMSETYGKTMHVDHIVPLAAEDVCGLHVPWNLQITTASFNASKQNKLEDYIPEATDWRNAVLIHRSALPWNLREKH